MFIKVERPVVPLLKINISMDLPALTSPPSFNDLPMAVFNIDRKLEILLNNKTQVPVDPIWFDLDEFRMYHPNKPSRATVYRWVSQRMVCFHKKGKALMFLKSEIDIWLLDGKVPTGKEMSLQAHKLLK